MENKIYVAPEMTVELNDQVSFLSSSGDSWTGIY